MGQASGAQPLACEPDLAAEPLSYLTCEAPNGSINVVLRAPVLPNFRTCGEPFKLDNGSEHKIARMHSQAGTQSLCDWTGARRVGLLYGCIPHGGLQS